MLLHVCETAVRLQDKGYATTPKQQVLLGLFGLHRSNITRLLARATE
jgi:hypothetical protein